MTSRAFAPAKINLFLHVGPPGGDGYHPLESWMVFADVGDTVELTPAESLQFEISGPFAEGLPRGGDNLVVRARDAALARVKNAPPAFRLTLDKQLPPASGIGGGSSDAAAMLRLISEVAGLDAGASMEIAAGLGADVPACLRAESLIARGRGEQLSAAPKKPPLPAVLVNPGEAVSTGKVFAAFDAARPPRLQTAALPQAFSSVGEVAEWLAGTRNDLEAPALSLCPAIVRVLEALESAAETRFTRMSGSGATCFALCETDADAASLAGRLTVARPEWWVRATRL